MCGPCGESGGAWAFAFFVSGLKQPKEVINWLVERGLMEPRPGIKSKIVAQYIYRDPSGKEVILAKKFLDTQGRKSFAYLRKEDGVWKGGIAGTKTYPYRINEWANKSGVYIVEGEKDADALWEWGIPATTNPCGAGSWKEEYNEYFKHKKVVIIPDNDEPGMKHAQAVLASLIPHAVAVKLVLLPGIIPKGDFSDWVAKCSGTKELLAQTVRKTEWATLADAGICEDPYLEAKRLVTRINYDIADMFEKTQPNYDRAWMWMKDNDDLWAKIKEAEDKMEESIASGDPFEIVKSRCMEWKLSFKNAIMAFLDFQKKENNHDKHG